MKNILLFAAMLLLTLTGCTSTQILTPAQKSDLEATGFAVAEVVQAEKAQQEPNPTTEPNYSNTVPAGTGGGLIPALIGAAIDASIKADQRKKFAAKYSQYSDAVEQNMPENISAALNTKVQEVIANNNYLSPLVTENSGKTLNTKIVSYGIQRTAKVEEEIYLTFGVIALMTLDSGAKKPVFNQRFVGLAAGQHTMKEYAEQPELLTEMSESALADLATKIKEFLDKIESETEK